MEIHILFPYCFPNSLWRTLGAPGSDFRSIFEPQIAHQFFNRFVHWVWNDVGPIWEQFLYYVISASCSVILSILHHISVHRFVIDFKNLATPRQIHIFERISFTDQLSMWHRLGDYVSWMLHHFVIIFQLYLVSQRHHCTPRFRNWCQKYVNKSWLSCLDGKKLQGQRRHNCTPRFRFWNSGSPMDVHAKINKQRWNQ